MQFCLPALPEHRRHLRHLRHRRALGLHHHLHHHHLWERGLPHPRLHHLLGVELRRHHPHHHPHQGSSVLPGRLCLPLHPHLLYNFRRLAPLHQLPLAQQDQAALTLRHRLAHSALCRHQHRSVACSTVLNAICICQSSNEILHLPRCLQPGSVELWQRRQAELLNTTTTS